MGVCSPCRALLSSRAEPDLSPPSRSGFVGQRLLLSLLEHYPSLNIVLTDISAPRIPRSLANKKSQIASLAADLSKEDDLARLFGSRSVDVVVALHGIMSGGSEADFELGYRGTSLHRDWRCHARSG